MLYCLFIFVTAFKAVTINYLDSTPKVPRVQTCLKSQFILKCYYSISSSICFEGQTKHTDGGSVCKIVLLTKSLCIEALPCPILISSSPQSGEIQLEKWICVEMHRQ